MNSLSRRHRNDLLLASLLAILSLAIYLATLTPSLSYLSPDGNELATVTYTLGLAHSTGYPLYTWLGKLFTLLPLGDVAHRVNLMSAVLGAAGVALLYLTLRFLLGRHWRARLSAATAALLFAFSRSFWSQTGIAEVYAPNLFMLALALLVTLLWGRVSERERAARPAAQSRWQQLVPGRRVALLLFAAALLWGLSLGTHMSNLGFAPAIALFVLLVDWRDAFSPPNWALGLGGFALGALQFLWLPFKAHTLNDKLMLGHAPRTLAGIYNYTLNAFPQFKFAFGWAEVPDRIVLYFALLVQQFGLPGTLLGLLGMWVLLFHRPKRFFLVFGMYLVHLVFFTQYAVFDLDVFFIPAHYLFAILIGFGAWQVLSWLAIGVRALASRLNLTSWPPRPARVLLISLAAILFLLGPTRELQANWQANDRSHDTAINDFYENVFQLLPANSVLLGRGGVFGYDMFYYRLVYDLRPDVLIPHLYDPNPAGGSWQERALFVTERPEQLATRGPWGLPPDLLPSDAWYVPLLLAPAPGRAGIGAGRGELTLWQVSSEPPTLIVPAATARPQYDTHIELAGKTLVGYDLLSETLAAGEALHLTLYWQLAPAADLHVSLGLDQSTLLSYQIGGGNLDRYLQANRPPAEPWLAADDFWLVLPRTSDAGPTSLALGPAAALDPRAAGPAGDLQPFAALTIEPAAPLLNWQQW